MEFLALLPDFDIVTIAGAYGPWAALGATTLVTAASIWCNNTETKNTKLYKFIEFIAQNNKKAKK